MTETRCRLTRMRQVSRCTATQPGTICSRASRVLSFFTELIFFEFVSIIIKLEPSSTNNINISYRISLF